MGGVKDMSWAAALVMSVTVQYALASFFYWREGNGGMSLAFAAYAVANIGLIRAGQE